MLRVVLDKAVDTDDSLTVSAGGQLVFPTELIYKKNFPLNGKTWWAKSSSQSGNLSSARPLKKHLQLLKSDHLYANCFKLRFFLFALGMYLAFVFVKIDPEAEKKKLEEAERRARERAEREKEREERAKAEQERAEKAKAEQEKKEEEAQNEPEKEETTEEKPQEEMETGHTEVAEESTQVESRKRKHEDDATTAEDNDNDDDGEPAAKKQEPDSETSG